MNNFANQYADIQYTALNDTFAESLKNLGLCHPDHAEDLFSYLAEAKATSSLRDIEPLMAYLVRFTKAVDFPAIMDKLKQYAANSLWDQVRRGGYLLDICLTYNPEFNDIDSTIIDSVANVLPKNSNSTPFFPQDKRTTLADDLANRWQLSSGILYDRLNQMLRPPYVC